VLSAIFPVVLEIKKLMDSNGVPGIAAPAAAAAAAAAAPGRRGEAKISPASGENLTIRRKKKEKEKKISDTKK